MIDHTQQRKIPLEGRRRRRRKERDQRRKKKKVNESLVWFMWKYINEEMVHLKEGFNTMWKHNSNNHHRRHNIIKFVVCSNSFFPSFTLFDSNLSRLFKCVWSTFILHTHTHVQLNERWMKWKKEREEKKTLK